MVTQQQEGTEPIGVVTVDDLIQMAEYDVNNADIECAGSDPAICRLIDGMRYLIEAVKLQRKPIITPNYVEVKVTIDQEELSGKLTSLQREAVYDSVKVAAGTFKESSGGE